MAASGEKSIAPFAQQLLQKQEFHRKAMLRGEALHCFKNPLCRRGPALGLLRKQICNNHWI